LYNGILFKIEKPSRTFYETVLFFRSLFRLSAVSFFDGFRFATAAEKRMPLLSGLGLSLYYFIRPLSFGLSVCCILFPAICLELPATVFYFPQFVGDFLQLYFVSHNLFETSCNCILFPTNCLRLPAIVFYLPQFVWNFRQLYTPKTLLKT